MIQIDGSNGGGQILRSALSLSLVTGQPFRMTNIRGARKPKPGLMRQHLTCVKAAAEIGDAALDGAELGSLELVFAPGKLKAGDYTFSIGTGGSTTLVFQTLLPALLQAEAPSTLRIEGGTHNPLAPPFEFIDQCFLPILRRMGAKVSLTLERPGFMQVGGGAIVATVQPLKKWKRLTLLERGDLVRTWGTVLHAHLSPFIAQREQQTASSAMGWEASAVTLQTVEESPGPGSIVMLGATYEHVTEISSAVAQIGRNAESVGSSAAKGLSLYLGNNGAVGKHLTDQLLLPLALAGTGSFTTFAMSRHTHAQMELIPQFLPIKFEIEEQEQGVRQVRVKKGNAGTPARIAS